MSTSAYDNLCRRFERIARLGEALAILHWDHAVVMPAAAAAGRSEQVAALEQVIHEALTAGDLAGDLDAAEQAPPDDPWDAANLRQMRRRRQHAAALPADLLAARTRANSICEMIWREARAADDFAAVCGPLTEVFNLTRHAAAAKAEMFGCDPYDALIDVYEPGLTAAHIDELFAEIEAFLPAMVPQALARQVAAGDPPATAMALDGQRRAARRLASSLGFDFAHGRLDESHHPFTGGVTDDVRITSRYVEGDVLSGLFAVIHECGHALYERGLPQVWRSQPVGRSMGMAVHESQSLLFEMQAARGPAFVKHLARVVAEENGGEAALAAAFQRQARHVAPGLLRYEADEVTYPLHILLRYRLEKTLLDGSLAVVDLPQAWSTSMGELLGLEVPDDRDGCLQDIHWITGSVGYFPSYTLGAVAAAQLFQSAEAAIGDLDGALARGDFAPLLAWLRETVHGKGSLYASASELLHAATGRSFDIACFKAHLERRYLA